MIELRSMKTKTFIPELLRKSDTLLTINGGLSNLRFPLLKARNSLLPTLAAFIQKSIRRDTSAAIKLVE